MRTTTSYNSEGWLLRLNTLPLANLLLMCAEMPLKLEINNGRITSATQLHRDYVSVYDGRNSYKEL
jgi:hypothetical protein